MGDTMDEYNEVEVYELLEDTDTEDDEDIVSNEVEIVNIENVAPMYRMRVEIK